MKEGNFMSIINPLPEGYVIPVNDKTREFYALMAALTIRYSAKDETDVVEP
jgi:hypothetical protein